MCSSCLSHRNIRRCPNRSEKVPDTCQCLSHIMSRVGNRMVDSDPPLNPGFISRDRDAYIPDSPLQRVLRRKYPNDIDVEPSQIVSTGIHEHFSGYRFPTPLRITFVAEFHPAWYAALNLREQLLVVSLSPSFRIIVRKKNSPEIPYARTKTRS